MQGLDFAREAMGKVEGSQRACLKKERDWWVWVMHSEGRSASI